MAVGIVVVDVGALLSLHLFFNFPKVATDMILPTEVFLLGFVAGAIANAWNSRGRVEVQPAER